MQNNFLPGYKIIEELGHGSQGQVFLAQRESDESPVAIKKLNIHSVKSWKAYDLFHREAEVLSGLDIDGVAKFYEAFDRLEDDPPCSYIVQEYIPGQPIAKMLKAGHHFSLNQVYDIIVQMLIILKQLHDKQVIHRDIKPSNILLVPLDGGRIKVYLIDFGAVANPQVQGGGSTMAGTFGYMPPEQLMGKPEPASDIYALAAVAVAMITGKSPADMPVKDFHLIFEPDMQSLPVEVVNTLRQMLEPDPTKRLCKYDALIEAFESFQINDYKNIQSYTSHFSVKEWDDQLKNVAAYGEPGNIDLWQGLDDDLPRKEESLPASYLSFNERTDVFYSDGNPVFDHTSFVKIETHTHENLSDLVKFMIVIIGLCVIYGGIRLIDNTSFLNVFGHYAAISILLFVLFFIGIIFLIVYIQKKDLFISQKEVKKNLTFYANHISLKPWIVGLLREGRKTIATICSIDYIECSKKYVEQHLLDENKSDSNAIALYAYHASPLFKISYQFNPPDDEKKEDLIHYIYTSIAPEGHYKVGDPLPILYRIYQNEDNRESVDSMPFPIPLDDIADDNHIIYHLTKEQIEQEAREREEERKRQKAEREKLEQLAKERELARQRSVSAREIKRQAYQKVCARESAKNKAYAQYSGKTANARAYQKGRRF